MRKYTEHCDLCEKELYSHHRVHGFCCEVGFSSNYDGKSRNWGIRGWGNRRNLINKGSWELCTNCFTKLRKKTYEFRDLLKELKNES